MRLTGPVVANNQHALVVHSLVERKLGDHLLGDPLGHVVGNDVGRNKLLGLIRTIGVQKLNDRLYRFKLNKIAKAHRHIYLPFQ